MSKNGQKPAFPFNLYTVEPGTCNNGMNKRFYAACAALQGLLSKYNLKEPEDQKIICKMAYELADELIKQENI